MELLDLEPALIERLTARVSASVRPLWAVADIERTPLPTPAVLVSYAGGSPVQSRPDARAVRLEVRWLITAVVRNVANASQSTAGQAIGPLVEEIIEAVMGWQPEGTSRPLTLSALPAPGFGSGYLWVPLEFSSELVRRVPPGTE